MLNDMVISAIAAAVLLAELACASVQAAALPDTHRLYRHAAASNGLTDVIKSNGNDCSASIVEDCNLSKCNEVVSYARRHIELEHRGHVLIYAPFPSVGNVLPSIYGSYELARYFNVALFIDSTHFPALSVALKPNILPYNNLKVNSTVIETLINDYGLKAAINNTNEHVFNGVDDETRLVALRFSDGVLQLPVHRWRRFYDRANMTSTTVNIRSLTSADVVPWTQHRYSCFFNAMFRKTVALETYIEMQARNWKFDLRKEDYIAWHIRTGDGERKAYNLSDDVYSYIHMDSPTSLCNAYKESFRLHFFKHGNDLAKMTSVPIYLTSNSIDVKRACVEPMNIGNGTMARMNITYMDTALIGMKAETNMHTDGHDTLKYDPRPGIAAFMDWIFLANAKTVFSGGSSFSETAKNMHETTCVHVIPATDLLERGHIRICTAHDG